MESGATTATAMTATPTLKAPSAAAASVTDCCICESARLDSGELRLISSQVFSPSPSVRLYSSHPAPTSQSVQTVVTLVRI